MSFITEYCTPFFNWYHSLIEGSYLSEALKYKGGKEIGTNYISKVNRYNRRTVEGKYPPSHTQI